MLEPSTTSLRKLSALLEKHYRRSNAVDATQAVGKFLAFLSRRAPAPSSAASNRPSRTQILWYISIVYIITVSRVQGRWQKRKRMFCAVSYPEKMVDVQ